MLAMLQASKQSRSMGTAARWMALRSSGMVMSRLEVAS